MKISKKMTISIVVISALVCLYKLGLIRIEVKKFMSID